jgi:hypothetical protein
MPTCHFCGCLDFEPVDKPGRLGIECSKCHKGCMLVGDRKFAKKLWVALEKDKQAAKSKPSDEGSGG